ncbi:MAG: HAMP domain-containing histidine kinase, partial [Bacteroidales bacterium]|nr:HAMP domain-containing histidine kinase [Bacteroidales bacterium]
NHSYRYYETTFSPVYSLQKRIFVALVINRGIIDGNVEFQQKNNYQSLNGSNPGEAFLRNISHELRTPLNWIIGFSSLLTEEKDLMKIKEYNYHIIKGGKLMLSSIEMLIDMSHIVKNEVTITKTTFAVNKLLYETADLLREDVQRMEYNLTVKVNSYILQHEDDRLIVSDEKKLRRVLNCLIHNSLKFTKDGYIELGCANLPEQTLLFYVKDTGIGISEDIKEYIFDAFRKSDSGTEDGLSGHGLGLSIAKNYVKLLGGNIWLDSECKKGTTLFFTIKDYSEAKPIPNYKDFVKETAQLLFPK